MFYSKGGTTFILAPRTRICQGTFEIVPQDVLWSIGGYHQHYEVPLSQMLHEILGHGHLYWHHQLIRHYTNLWTYYRTGPYCRFWPYYQIWEGFHRILQRMRLANRGRLLLRTPGPVPFGTCILSNVETILSWTCHVYGPFEFRTSLGTSISLEQGYVKECLKSSLKKFYGQHWNRIKQYEAPLAQMLKLAYRQWHPPSMRLYKYWYNSTELGHLPNYQRSP